MNNYARASLIWAIVSAAATSIPGAWLPRITGVTNLIVDNSSHFIIFLILAFLLTRSFLTRSLPVIPWKAAFFSILICVFYGFSLEILQIPIPGRAFEWSDGLANAAGAIVGAVLVLFRGRSPNKK